MKQLAKIIFGIFIILCGITTTGMSIYALYQGVAPLVALSLLGGCLFGVALMLAGTAIAKGERIRDIIDTFILGN